MPSNARQAVTPLNIQQLLAAKQMGLGDYIAQAEMKSRTPTLRERIGNLIYDAAQGAGLRQSAQSMRSNAETGMDFVPVLGDAIGAQEAGRDLGAGNYLSGGLGLAATLVPGAIAEKAVKKGIKGFHGSPHDFDRFDSSKIGTGEGAQAYGHGLYIAESEGVAKSYRDNLAPVDVNHRADGEPISHDMQRMIGEAWQTVSGRSMGPTKITDAIDLVDDALMRQRADAMQARDMDWFNKVEDMRLEARRIRENPPTAKGKMYEVNINADPDDFLDWDKPLSEQSEKVRGGVRAGMDERYGQGFFDEYAQQGHDFRDVRSNFDDLGDAEVSNMLREKGIPGIKYLDGGSRKAGDGSRNYVVFDDRLIDIVRKWGIPAAISTGLITQEMADQMQQQGEI
jgi:hypothetical protein